jgi:hypothetical protein
MSAKSVAASSAGAAGASPSGKGKALKGVAEDVLERMEHEKYVHTMGMQILKMRLREDKQRKLDMEKLRGKVTVSCHETIYDYAVGWCVGRQNVAHKLIRKRVKVSDMDAGGLSVQIDQGTQY